MAVYILMPDLYNNQPTIILLISCVSCIGINRVHNESYFPISYMLLQWKEAFLMPPPTMSK